MEDLCVMAGHFAAKWRKRVGVEPTILLAKSRINGFEGHEGHRTPFASRRIIAGAPRNHEWLPCRYELGARAEAFLRARLSSFKSVQTS